MKVLCKQLFQSFVLGAVLPGVIFSAALRLTVSGAPVQKPTPDEGDQTLPEIQAKPRRIPVLLEDGVVEMELESYITRVVLGEVAASFHPEALKAQAVAARTYTLRCVAGGDKHPQGAVCTDYRCCQAYREPEEYLSSGGTREGLDKISAAVEGTAGEVLYYGDALICATYFASSGGVTEDAREVWGQAYPYLVSVESPGEEDCGYYEQTVTFDAEEFRQRLGVSLRGTPKDWFGMVTYTDGEGVDLMRVGGKLYTGVELRSKLGLRSTVFTVSTTEDTVTFDTRGYGHRVGMSQHGANAMASAGSDYVQILAHYYTGATLSQYLSDGD